MVLTPCAGPKLSTSSKAPAIYRRFVRSWATRTLRVRRDFSDWKPTQTHLRSVEHPTFDPGGIRKYRPRKALARRSTHILVGAIGSSVGGLRSPRRTRFCRHSGNLSHRLKPP